jgi:5-methylthioribose kinase
MIQLSADNAVEFLRRVGRLPPGPVHVTYLSGGVSNIVLRVEGADGRFVLKQSCPQLRTREDWFSDLDRIYREQEVMQTLEPHLTEGTIPKVLWAEREHFVFAMSHAPLEAVVWKERLLAGEVDAAAGALAGQVLGRMHAFSYDRPELFERFRDPAVYIQLRVDPFYRTVQSRRPEVAAAIGAIIDEMLSRADGLNHGDYTPKNILLHDAGFMLVDYETASFGDPTMDLGLFLAHILLKAVRRPEWRPRYFDLVRRFWDAYSAAKDADAEWQRRGVRHLGVCLLARIDGTSPVDYLPEEPKRDFVRRLGRAILLDGIATWKDVLAWCERGMGALCARTMEA